MRQTRGGNQRTSQLTRMIEREGPGGDRPSGRSLWQRLNMEQVARRLIQTARLAAAEQAMGRLSERMAERELRKGKPQEAATIGNPNRETSNPEPSEG